MIYRDFKGMKLSALGLGTMRLPLLTKNEKDIDELQVRKMVDYAIEHGINYFDTAWGYHSGNSELAVGRALAKYPRDKFYLADKFPGYDLKNMPRAKKIFEQQLYKCGVTYFDFYLIHNVCDLNINQYLDPKYGIKDYFVEQRRIGKIKHLGFSSHGAPEVLTRFLETYGDVVEFCQLQLNWLDWDFQRARECVEICKAHNLPVWVMEPLRGGMLCKLPDKFAARLKEDYPERTGTEWAFRFVQSIPEVTVVLSGMSNMEQLQENITYFEKEAPISQSECDKLRAISREMTEADTVPCTACRYCTSHCPQQLDIPHLISLYNEHKFSGGGFLAPMAILAIAKDKRPNSCISCGSCEQLCPQQIHISEIMRDFAAELDKLKGLMAAFAAKEE